MKEKKKGEKKAPLRCTGFSGTPRASVEFFGAISGGLVWDTKGAVLASPRPRVAVREEIMDETNKSFSPLPRHEAYRPSEVMSNCPGQTAQPVNPTLLLIAASRDSPRERLDHAQR